jgi:phosphoglycolate phosphatase-like HAD superfamily hydrolase
MKLFDANSNALKRTIVTNRCRLVIFDFGGTIYDFTPVHVECFREALGRCGSRVHLDAVKPVVARSIRAGEDSFAIADRLIQKFALVLDSRELAVQKRVLVEERIALTRLEEGPKQFMLELVRDQVGVAIVTRGMKQSAKRIVENTWPEIERVAEKIPVFGRLEMSEVTNKRLLLRLALRHFCLPAAQSLFVGDSKEDAEIALAERLPHFDLGGPSTSAPVQPSQDVGE